jgi:hypothetical protein
MPMTRCVNITGWFHERTTGKGDTDQVPPRRNSELRRAHFRFQISSDGEERHSCINTSTGARPNP